MQIANIRPLHLFTFCKRSTEISSPQVVASNFRHQRALVSRCIRNLWLSLHVGADIGKSSANRQRPHRAEKWLGAHTETPMELKII